MRMKLILRLHGTVYLGTNRHDDARLQREYPQQTRIKKCASPVTNLSGPLLGPPVNPNTCNIISVPPAPLEQLLGAVSSTIGALTPFPPPTLTPSAQDSSSFPKDNENTPEFGLFTLSFYNCVLPKTRRTSIREEVVRPVNL